LRPLRDSRHRRRAQPPGGTGWRRGRMAGRPAGAESAPAAHRNGRHVPPRGGRPRVRPALLRPDAGGDRPARPQGPVGSVAGGKPQRGGPAAWSAALTVERAQNMLIGVDFDNTIVCYDELFHRVAVEQGLIPSTVPATKGEVRRDLEGRGLGDVWTELQGYVY